MRIVVDGKDSLKEELIVRFEGVTTYGEEVSLYANYSKDLKMTECSSVNSSMNNARYYVEVAEYFKAMLELEGSEKLREAFKQVEDIEKKYDDEEDSLYDELYRISSNIEDVTSELTKMNKDVFNLNSQVKLMEKSLKKCRKQSSIDDRQKDIDDLNEQIESMEKKNKNKKDELKKSLSLLRGNRRKIEQKIDENWHNRRQEMMVEIVRIYEAV